MRSMGMVQPYVVGVSIISLVSGATPIKFSPAARQIGTWIQKNSGSGGTLAIANGYGASTANSFIIGETQMIQINGPAQFFLCAGGATCNVAVFSLYDQGYSLGAIF